MTNLWLSRGFSFIELMIVVTVIAILLAIFGPSFLRARAQARLAHCQSSCKKIGTALSIYLFKEQRRALSRYN
jgi:prepilin-type N-terminal cleavage/methylation domain-containing protein